MKRHIILLWAMIFAIEMMAETYTIVFNSSNSDSTSPTEDLSAIIYSATGNCVEKIITANKIYRAKEGFGIKGGTGSIKGELTIGLDDTYSISSMTVYSACYGTDSTKTYGLYVCGKKIQ